jgi:hypothetical protein
MEFFKKENALVEHARDYKYSITAADSESGN